MVEITEMPKNYVTLARDKIAGELKDFSGGNKEKSVSKFVASAITNFCEEDARFAEVVAKTKRTLSDCCAEALKGCGNHISDIDVYRGAVRFYFPNADIHMTMTIEINGAAPDEAHMNKETKKPAPAPAAKPKVAEKKPAATAKSEKKEPDTIQLSLF